MKRTSRQRFLRLALRLLEGLTIEEIAHAFVEPEGTTTKRITQAKAKLAANNIACRIAADHEFPERIHAGATATRRFSVAGR